MLMRFDPFADLDRWTSQVTGKVPVMPMDAWRHGDKFTVQLDLPGIDPSSIDLHVEKNVLTVSAERTWKPEEGQQVLMSERPQGSFSRQLFLGDSLDAGRIEAAYENGVLTVTIPVAEAAKPRKVEIMAGSGNGNGKTKAISTESKPA